MISYLMLKQLHVSAVAVSGCLFLLRGGWMLAGASLLQQRWVRIVPHLVDTVLLASAIALVLRSAQYPWQRPWLTAKLLALIAYIVLGSIALKRGRSYRVRVIALLAAISTFGYIVGVALTRSPTLNLF